MEYKFKIGDKIEVVDFGAGCGKNHVGTVVTVLALGSYNGKPAYKVGSPAIGNSESGAYDGFIAEHMFKLYESSKGKVYTVPRGALREIYPKVCSGWQKAIEDLLEKQLFDEHITVPAILVDNAYLVADTDEQRAWLREYLPIETVIDKTTAPVFIAIDIETNKVVSWGIIKSSLERDFSGSIATGRVIIVETTIPYQVKTLK